MVHRVNSEEDDTIITEDYKSSVNSPKELKQKTRKNSDMRPDHNGHWLALTVAEKHEQYHYAKVMKPGFRRAAKTKIREKVECSSSCMKSFIFLRLPIIEWLFHYNIRKNLFGDIVAGITVAVMHIPQGMAYGLLARLDPISGIYMAIFPVLFYAIFASSRHCSMGSFAVICLMSGGIVSEFATFQDVYSGNSGNAAAVNETEIITYTPQQVSAALCFAIAIWMFLFGIFNLGVLSVFLSDMLISGFTTGAAVQVLTSQLKSLFGVSIKTHNGMFNVLLTWKALFEKILESNPATMVISLACIAVLLFNNEIIKPCLARVSRIPIPIELIVVVGGTLASMYGNLKGNYEIQIVGYVPTGLPSPTLPTFELLGKVLVPSLPIATVSFCISFALAKIFAKRRDYAVDPTQELYATAIGNAVGSLFQCPPISASLSRSIIQESVGGATQLTSIISCSILALVLIFVGQFFETLPMCVLAAIIVTSLKGMFLQVWDFIKMWKISKTEASVWLISFLSVVIIDIDYGLFMGVAASFFILIYKCQTPNVSILGRVPNTDIYLDIDKYSSVDQLSGIKILHIAGTLHFANKEFFRQHLIKATGIDPKMICKTEQKEKKKEAKERLRKTSHLGNSNGHLSTITPSPVMNGRLSIIENGIIEEEVENPIPSNSTDTTSTNENDDKFPNNFTDVKSIILDMSGVGHIDIAGAQNLALVYKEYAAAHISLYYSALSDSCLEVMESSGALEAVPQKYFFHSIHDAVFCVSFPELQPDQAPEGDTSNFFSNF